MDAHPHNVPTEQLLAHAGWMRGLARSLVNEDAAAEDLVQETWLAALRRPPRDDGALRPWLARTLRNAAHMRLRGGAARAAREVEGARDEALAGPDERAECMETQRLLADLVMELDEPYRGTVWQRYYEGIAPAEIARREGIPAGSVRRRLSVALARLREELDRRHGGDRATWCQALAPLLSARTLETGIAAGLAALIPGALIVKTISLSACAVAAVLIAYSALSSSRPEPDLILSGHQLQAADLVEVARPELSRSVDPGGERVTASTPGSGSSPPAATGSSAPQFRLTARVLDPEGLPLEGARAQFQLGRRLQSVTGGDGRVLLEAARVQHAGNCDLVLEATGFVERRVRVEVHAGGAADLGDLFLERGGGVQGSVVDQEGQPVGGAALAAEAYQPGEFDPEERVINFDPHGVVRGRADGQGSFGLDGLLPGRYRVLARAGGTLLSRSAPFDVRAGEVSDAGVIVLDPTPSSQVIDGTVYDEAGQPAAFVQARLISTKPGLASIISGSVDGGGRFRFGVSESGPYDLVIVHKARELRATRTGLQPGDRDLELHLAPIARTEVLVRDQERETVEGYNVTVWTSFDLASGSRSGAGISIDRDGTPGTCSFATPLHPFLLTVTSGDHLETDLGPFDPRHLQGAIEVTLEALPRLRGRVVHGGEPLAGVEVCLRGVPDTQHLYEQCGFPLERTQPFSGGTTDEDGRFELPMTGLGERMGANRLTRFVVQARSSGFATAESKSFGEPGPPADLELELTRGGSIEGQVRGSIPDEHVAASCGDGELEVVRMDGEGRYRFENLRPGRWCVRAYPREFLGTSNSGTYHGESHPWNCTVTEGRITTLDLDPGAESHVVRGQLDVTAGAFWTATLVAPNGSDMLTRARYGSAELNDEGSFELTAPQGGWHVLDLRSASDAGAEVRISDRLDVTTGEPWSLGWEPALLEGRLERTELLEGAGLWHAWNPSPNRWVLTRLVPDADGTFEALVPVGTGALVLLGKESWRGPRHAQELAPVQVPAGGRSGVVLR